MTLAMYFSLKHGCELFQAHRSGLYHYCVSVASIELRFEAAEVADVADFVKLL